MGDLKMQMTNEGALGRARGQMTRAALCLRRAEEAAERLEMMISVEEAPVLSLRGAVSVLDGWMLELARHVRFARDELVEFEVPEEGE